jgi:carbon-monoxide dehydrogenase medium subunit
MKPAPFSYHRPTSEAEALDMLGSLDNARALAGGQSLMPMLNFRYATADHLVDLNRIPELTGVDSSATDVRIRAMTRQNTLLEHAELARRCPIVHEALCNVGHLPTRTRGTFGGSLAQMDPAAELIGIAALHDAHLTIASKATTRRIQIEDFPLAYMTPNLNPDELLIEADWEFWPSHHGYCFVEFAQRPGDFAIVGAGVLLTLSTDRNVNRAAIVLIGVGKGPLRLHEAEAALIGAPAKAESWRAAAATASAIDPMEDTTASSTYRRRLARTLVERALQKAAERALDRNRAP